MSAFTRLTDNQLKFLLECEAYSDIECLLPVVPPRSRGTLYRYRVNSSPSGTIPDDLETLLLLMTPKEFAGSWSME